MAGWWSDTQQDSLTKGALQVEALTCQSKQGASPSQEEPLHNTWFLNPACTPSSHATHPGKLGRHPRPWATTQYGRGSPAKALPRLLLRLQTRAEPGGRLLLRLLRLLEGHHGPRCACCGCCRRAKAGQGGAGSASCRLWRLHSHQSMTPSYTSVWWVACAKQLGVTFLPWAIP